MDRMLQNMLGPAAAATSAEYLARQRAQRRRRKRWQSVRRGLVLAWLLLVATLSLGLAAYLIHWPPPRQPHGWLLALLTLQASVVAVAARLAWQLRRGDARSLQAALYREWLALVVIAASLSAGERAIGNSSPHWSWRLILGLVAVAAYVIQLVRGQRARPRGERSQPGDLSSRAA